MDNKAKKLAESIIDQSGGFAEENTLRRATEEVCGALQEEKAGGIAQGRREAAEEYCASECAWSSPVGCQRKIGECSQRKAILGTASDEKTDKGEPKP